MPYIGKTPTVGNFQVCDAISVVNGQAAYTLQVGGVNVAPESANHMLVSLNGILQKPGSSFTISGSTMTFASNLATGDVIDFVQILGNVLDIGQPSDDTVKTASIQANAVTGAKLNTDVISAQTALTSAPDDTDELLISDAGTLKRIDYSLIKSAPGLNLISTTTISSGTANVDITSGIDSTYKNYQIHVLNLHPSSDGQKIQMRFFNSSGIVTASSYGFATDGRREENTQLSHAGSSESYIRFSNQGLGYNNDESASIIINLFNPSDTTFQKTIQGNIVFINDSGNMCVEHFGGTYDGTFAVTGVRFYMTSGNIDSAIIKLYGIS